MLKNLVIPKGNLLKQHLQKGVMNVVSKYYFLASPPQSDCRRLAGGSLPLTTCNRVAAPKDRALKNNLKTG